MYKQLEAQQNNQSSIYKGIIIALGTPVITVLLIWLVSITYFCFITLPQIQDFIDFQLDEIIRLDDFIYLNLTQIKREIQFQHDYNYLNSFHQYVVNKNILGTNANIAQLYNFDEELVNFEQRVNITSKFSQNILYAVWSEQINNEGKQTDLGTRIAFIQKLLTIHNKDSNHFGHLGLQFHANYHDQSLGQKILFYPFPNTNELDFILEKKKLKAQRNCSLYENQIVQLEKIPQYILPFETECQTQKVHSINFQFQLHFQVRKDYLYNNTASIYYQNIDNRNNLTVYGRKKINQDAAFFNSVIMGNCNQFASFSNMILIFINNNNDFHIYDQIFENNIFDQTFKTLFKYLPEVHEQIIRDQINIPFIYNTNVDNSTDSFQITPYYLYEKNENLKVQQKLRFLFVMKTFSQQQSCVVQNISSSVNYIKYILLSLGFVFTLLILFYSIRFLVSLGLNVEEPIARMLEFIHQIDNDHPQNMQNDLLVYQQYYTSADMKQLIQSILTLFQNIQFSNRRNRNTKEFSRGKVLLQLSLAKKFYLSVKNIAGVGICSNNIANIHLQQERYLESIAQYQQAILMGQIEFKQSKERFLSIVQDIEEFNSDEEKIENVGRSLKSIKKSKISWKQIQRYFYKTQIEQIDKSSNKKVYVTYNSKVPMIEEQAFSAMRPISKSEAIKPDAFGAEMHNNLNVRQNTFLNNSLNHNYQYNGSSNTNNNNNRPRNHSQFRPAALNQSSQKESERQREIKYTQQLTQYQFSRNVSTVDRSDFEDDLIFQMMIIRARLVNRKYQFASAMFQYSTRHQAAFYHETIRVLQKCLQLLQQQQYMLKSIQNRQISVLLQKAFCHIMINDLNKATTSLKKAKKAFLKLEDQNHQSLNLGWEIRISQIDDFFVDIPPSIIQSKIQLMDGLLEQANGNMYEASELLVDCLTQGTVFDPNIARFSLEALKTICQSSSIKVDMIEQHLDDLSPKDMEIIFLIDYSKFMKPEQILVSHAACKLFYNLLRDDDQLGMILFNQSLHESFSLQQQKKFKSLIEQKISNISLKTG